MKKLSATTTAIACLFLFLSSFALAQEQLTKPGVHPYISLSEEYNDNINLTATNKTSDFITTVSPGLKYINSDAVSGVDLDFNLGFVSYAKESQNNYISANGSLNAKYLTKEHVNFYLRWRTGLRAGISTMSSSLKPS